ncbi:DMT family transporter [Pseudopedobacter beijingensis]|uniref:DMT family transporter n=1 Tax=Pseudopedobacter beijingensis TaxID=1207056 RepID=A0ABW4IC37_9SPHI
MKLKISNVLILHFTVLIWGFTGILGALISINEVHLVWYRVGIAAITLYLYFKIKGVNFRIPKDEFIRIFITGGIVGLHWILFFGSIKASTVSVGIVCLSSLTLFTALLEPLFKAKSISFLEICIGMLIILGVYMIFKFETQYKIGILMGISSAFCASIFSIINSKLIKKNSATVITFYEMSGAFFWISLYLLLSGGFNSGLKLNTKDFAYLMLLSTVCTSFAYVLGVGVMKELTAFRVALVTNLEPIYGIVLALIIFGKTEQMTSGFYTGASIILGTVFMYPIIKSKIEKRKLSKRTPLY